MTERETLKAIREGILSGKCSDGNLAWVVNLCDESLAESGSANAGNAAAMYKALCEIIMLTMKVGYSIHGDVACGIIASKAKHALSAPARNCDVEYADRVEMYGAFKDWCKAKGHTMEPMLAYDAFDWLLAPAEKRKGDGDGSK